jgi:hypothetical protein
VPHRPMLCAIPSYPKTAHGAWDRYKGSERPGADCCGHGTHHFASRDSSHASCTELRLSWSRHMRAVEFSYGMVKIRGTRDRGGGFQEETSCGPPFRFGVEPRNSATIGTFAPRLRQGQREITRRAIRPDIYPRAAETLERQKKTLANLGRPHMTQARRSRS